MVRRPRTSSAKATKAAPRGQIPKLSDEAERLLNAATLVARDHGVTKVETIVEFGKPAECILDVAKREKADAIVMGSHGYSDLKGLFVGSLSHQVAHEADCPCIAIT